MLKRDTTFVICFQITEKTQQNILSRDPGMGKGQTLQMFISNTMTLGKLVIKCPPKVEGGFVEVFEGTFNH